jgi:hypothetical protein
LSEESESKESEREEMKEETHAHRLDYDLLKKIQDHPKVIEVKGTYMGSSASIGPSQESSAQI